MIDRRKIYLRRNTIMSLVFEVLTIINGFILPRFILTYFGSATNGLISSVNNFLGFIALCEVGMGAVVPANLYKPLADNDLDKISAIIVSAQKFYRLVAMIMVGYVAILTIVYPLLTSEFNHSFTASLIIIISISTFAQYYFGITYTLLLKADQRQYISLVINSATLILNTVLSILLITKGCSIHIVKAISSLIFITRPLFLNIYVRKHYNLNLKVKYNGEPIEQKWNGMAQHLASTIQEKADTIILTFFSTLGNVSVYGVYFMVVNGMRGFIYASTAGISAMIGNMLAKKEMSALKRTFSRFEWTMHTISTLLFTITGILIVPFVKVYTLGITDVNYIVPEFAYLLCLALAFRCMQMPYNIVVQAANHFKQTQGSAIMEPVINIVISVILVYKWGLVGVAVGTLVSMIYRVIYLAIYLMRNILYTRIDAFFKQIAIDAISVVFMILGTSWISMKEVTYYHWIGMAFCVSMICLGISGIVNIIFYRENVIQCLHPLIAKFKGKIR